jgi:hypothetical protein
MNIQFTQKVVAFWFYFTRLAMRVSFKLLPIMVGINRRIAFFPANGAITTSETDRPLETPSFAGTT